MVSVLYSDKRQNERYLIDLSRTIFSLYSGTGVSQDTEYLPATTYYYESKEPGGLSVVIWERKGVGHQVVRWWDDGGTNPIHPYIRAGILAALVMVSLYTILCIFCDYLACNYQQA